MTRMVLDGPAQDRTPTEKVAVMTAGLCSPPFSLESNLFWSFSECTSEPPNARDRLSGTLGVADKPPRAKSRALCLRSLKILHKGALKDLCALSSTNW